MLCISLFIILECHFINKAFVINVLAIEINAGECKNKLPFVSNEYQNVFRVAAIFADSRNKCFRTALHVVLQYLLHGTFKASQKNLLKIIISS